MESPTVQGRRRSPSEGSASLAEKKPYRPATSSRQVLYSLAPEDFQDVLEISSRFRDCRALPTTIGKALHFFLPETVMLWDQAIVRNTYKLRPDPERYVSYQHFGCVMTSVAYAINRFLPMKTLSRVKELLFHPSQIS